MNKVQIKDTENKGKGIFATELIKSGDLIFDWEKGGIIYEKDKASDLPVEAKDYAIQFAEHTWIDTEDFGRWINHSCAPNSGINGLYKLVAIQDIQPDEEIVWDYDTTENSDWEIKNCECGSERCRKWIHGYQFLPDEIKQEYTDFTSDWLK